MHPIPLALLLACTGASDDNDSDESVPAQLALSEVLDLNAVVATKGMDVHSDGTVYVWNYNQDALESWDGTALTTLSTGALVSSYGTDLAVDRDGAVYVSKGGSTTGDVLMKWDPAGTPQWGDGGLTLSGALLLGLDATQIDGEPRVYVADGAAGQVHVLSPVDGAILFSFEVPDVPIDIAVDPDGGFYVLTSGSSNPVVDDLPVTLRRFAATGTEIAVAGPLTDAIYLALGPDGVVYVSVTDFELPTRQIAAFSPSLELRTDTPLPASYTGFSGGIATDADGRVYVTAQQGTGSDPICDVLVFQ